MINEHQDWNFKFKFKFLVTPQHTPPQKKKTNSNLNKDMSTAEALIYWRLAYCVNRKSVLIGFEQNIINETQNYASAR